jgi:Ca-activated chloride channel family protein
MVERQGTAIGAAIEQAARSFGEDAAKSKAIIVISDGESFEDNGVTRSQRSSGKQASSSTLSDGLTHRSAYTRCA